MAELTYYVAVTLDGWIADPHGDTSAFLTEGDHLAALAVAYPETFPAPYRAALGIDAANQRFDTVVMGRKTYAPALDAGLTSPYPHLRQSVVSRTLSGRTDPAVTVVADDPVEHVRRLKDSSQLGVWLCGGGQLASALAPEIDALVLKVNPVVIGQGTPLFAAATSPSRFQLTSLERYDSGVVVQHLRR